MSNVDELAPREFATLAPREFATGEKESKHHAAFHGDVIFYRLVAKILGAVAVGSLLSIAVLSGLGHFYPADTTAPWPVPESLTALGSAALGALAGLFTGSHGDR